MTGLPYASASAATRPKVSGVVDGATTTRAPASSPAMADVRDRAHEGDPGIGRRGLGDQRGGQPVAQRPAGERLAVRPGPGVEQQRHALVVGELAGEQERGAGLGRWDLEPRVGPGHAHILDRHPLGRQPRHVDQPTPAQLSAMPTARIRRRRTSEPKLAVATVTSALAATEPAGLTVPRATARRW
jgi:hypothetical protein